MAYNDGGLYLRQVENQMNAPYTGVLGFFNTVTENFANGVFHSMGGNKDIDIASFNPYQPTVTNPTGTPATPNSGFMGVVLFMLMGLLFLIALKD
jgi:hypothetical protein